MLAGRGRRLRTRIARELDLQQGHRVLDVGCGDGTLTLSLAKVVGPDGWAGGIDAFPEMITATTAKAAGPDRRPFRSPPHSTCHSRTTAWMPS